MPGLIGFSGLCADSQTKKIILEKMQEIITHRDFYCRDTLFCDEHVCTTRSHIGSITLAPQPFVKSGIYVWLDGEIYKQEKLEVYRPEVHNDAELICMCYEKAGGLDFLDAIDGVYTAVIYDSIKRKVYLITDRYGLRYMYWTIHNGWLAWFPETKAVLALPGFNPKIDRQAVDEFFGIGYLTENRSWFEGVSLLPSGSYLEWDISTKSMSIHQYWWWDRIKLRTEKINVHEAVEETSRLFMSSMNKVGMDDLRLGITLSGGVDSRALLGALPEKAYPIHAVTFGQSGCDDIMYAKMAADIRGAQHHVSEINAQNWLISRLEAVWWTDGQKSLIHAHGTESLDLFRSLFDVVLDGIATVLINGDFLYSGGTDVGPRRSCFDKPFTKEMAAVMLGCDAKLISDADFHKYEHLIKSDIYMIQNRTRRFTNDGIRNASNIIHHRMPFYDNDMIEFVLSLPDTIRRGKNIYHHMLLGLIPEYYKSIPWQNSGFTIDTPQMVIKCTRLFRKVARYPRQTSGLHHSFVNYDAWMRCEPARTFIGSVLLDKSALYREYVSGDAVEDMWNRHLAGENLCSDISLYLTFEIWLQQLFNNRYRQWGQ